MEIYKAKMADAMEDTSKTGDVYLEVLASVEYPAISTVRVIAVGSGRSISLDGNPLIDDLLIMDNDKLTKLRVVPQAILDSNTFTVKKEMVLRRHVNQCDLAKIVVRLQEIVNGLEKGQWDRYGFGHYINMSKLRDKIYSDCKSKKAGLFWCNECNKLHLSENQSQSKRIQACLPCVSDMTKCSNCGTSVPKQIPMSKKYRGLYFCSKGCETRYVATVPRFEYSDETPFFMPKNTYINIQDRNFGVELEIAGLQKVKPFVHLTETFQVVNDPSIRDAPIGRGQGEFVSKPLNGDNGLKALNEVANYFTKTGISSNEACGFHLHVDVTDLDKHQFVTLSQFAKKNESVFFDIVAKNRNGYQYCKHISGIKYPSASKIESFTDASDAFVYLLQGDVSASDNMRTKENYRSSKKHGSRYGWFNINPYMNQGTVEIRLFQGTILKSDMVYWTKLWIAIIEAIKAGTITGDTVYPNFIEMLDELTFTKGKIPLMKYFLKGFLDTRSRGHGVHSVATARYEELTDATA